MANDETPKKSALDQIEGVFGRWFLPIVGFIYASGFLIVFTFLKSYGIADMDFVQAKYIHVGSFFLIACIAVILPLGWLRYLSFTKGYPHTTIPTILGATAMLFVVFAVGAFTPVGFYRDHWLTMILNLLLPAIQLFTGVIADRLAKEGKARIVILAIQWVLFLLQLYVVWVTFRVLDNFWEMCRREPVSAVFVVLMILILGYGSRLRYRLSQAETRGQEFNLIFSNGSIIGLFIYLAIWSFARSIYPYIPASRGGGSFAGEEVIQLTFKPDFRNYVPTQVETANEQKHLIVLEESATAVFVADVTAAGGPKNWRDTKPPVYEIRLDTVTTISRNN